MINLEIKINSAIDAVNLVKKAGNLKYDADFSNGRCLVDAKSILGVLSADFSKPCKVVIIADELDENVNEFIDSIREKIISMEVN